MGVELNGIAHIQLTVNDPGRCVPFWEKFCHFLGMQTLIRGDDVVYCIGGRTGVMVGGAPRGTSGGSFDQNRAGLHHVCFRARNREDVDAIHRFLVDELAARIVHPPEDGSQFARDTTRFSSRIPTGSGSRSTTSPARVTSARAVDWDRAEPGPRTATGAKDSRVEGATSAERGAVRWSNPR